MRRWRFAGGPEDCAAGAGKPKFSKKMVTGRAGGSGGDGDAAGGGAACHPSGRAVLIPPDWACEPAAEEAPPTRLRQRGW